jgi:hypothetical protein
MKFEKSSALFQSIESQDHLDRLLDQRDQRYGWSVRGSGNESEVEEINRAVLTRGAPVSFGRPREQPPPRWYCDHSEREGGQCRS